MAPSVNNADNPNQRDEFNRTLLHVNVYENRLSAVKELLQRGADISLTSNKANTPLHTAASRRYPHMVEALLKFCSCSDKVKKCINAKTTQSGSTALHVAVSNGCVRSVLHLLAYGANFEVRNHAGERPIDVVTDAHVRRVLENVETDAKLAVSGKFEALRTKIWQQYSSEELAATLHSHNRYGWTTLQLAVRQNHAKTVNVICETRVGPTHWNFVAGDNTAMFEEMKRQGKEVAKRQLALVMHADDINVIGAEAMVEEIAEILAAAYKVVKIAEMIVEGKPSSLAIVEETLEALEFKQEHVTRDAKGKLVFNGYKAKYYKMMRVPPVNDDEYDDFFDEPKIISYMCILAVAIARSVATFMRTICTGKDEKEFDEAYSEIQGSHQLRYALASSKS